VIGHCGGVGPPSKWKKRCQKRIPRKRTEIVGTRGLVCAVSGNRSGRAALRREQEQLGSE
jgi:hypothetical protein